ncbi:hypothetical protein, partial [Luteimonas sp. SDU101]|uniref:hypothetical protein n=1 Tax=Luteimonas sp. SDU101 TaxID=3422593 RepID=UPI003EBC96B2
MLRRRADSAGLLARYRRHPDTDLRRPLAALTLLLALHGHAQDLPEAGDGQAAHPPATEMAPVRVIGHRPDPFGFRNPVETDSTVFDRAWDEPPGLEEIGMRGGIVQMGINKGLELAAKGIRSLPNWQNQVIGAEARPPPLDEAQLERAMRMHKGGRPAAASSPPSDAPRWPGPGRAPGRRRVLPRGRRP